MFDMMLRQMRVDLTNMYPLHLVLSGRFTWPFHFPAALAPSLCMSTAAFTGVACPYVRPSTAAASLYFYSHLSFIAFFSKGRRRVHLKWSFLTHLPSTSLRTLPRIYLNISNRLICWPNIVRFLTSKIRSL